MTIKKHIFLLVYSYFITRLFVFYHSFTRVLLSLGCLSFALDTNYRSDERIIRASKALLKGRFDINKSTTSSPLSPSTTTTTITSPSPVVPKLPTALSVEETEGLSQLSDEADDMRQYDYQDGEETTQSILTSSSSTAATTITTHNNNSNSNNDPIIAIAGVGVLSSTANIHPKPPLLLTPTSEPTEPAVQIVSAYHDRHQAEYIAHMIDYMLSAGLVAPSEVSGSQSNDRTNV